MKSLLEIENDYKYSPLQPEILYMMNNYVEYKPVPPLNRHIAYYYQFDVPENVSDSFSFIPDGCFDLVFCCCKNKQSSFLWASSAKRSRDLKLSHNCKYFGVKFLPEQNIIKFDRTMKELLGKPIPLSDVLPITPNMIKKVAAAPHFHGRIRAFEKILDKYAKELKEQETIEYCFNEIYLGKGNEPISEIVAGTGFSDRYVRRLFEQYVGYPPKEFSEIVRFQHSLSMLLGDNDLTMIDVAYESGYHDQAHFTRSFKKHTGMSPSGYRKLLLRKCKSQTKEKKSKQAAG